jgi:hypothetical protein
VEHAREDPLNQDNEAHYAASETIAVTLHAGWRNETATASADSERINENLFFFIVQTMHACLTVPHNQAWEDSVRLRSFAR